MKPKTKKLLIIGGLIIALLIVAIIIIKKIRSKTAEDQSKKALSNTTEDLGSGSKRASGGSASKYVEANDQDFSKWTKGRPVKLMQTQLNATDKAGLSVDGFWGEKTEAAVRKHVSQLFPTQNFGSVIQCRITWTDESKTKVKTFSWF